MSLFPFISFALLVLFSACSTEQKAPPPPPVNVTNYVVERETIPAVFDFIGFAESSHPVEIRARVEGYLDKITYTEGKMVKQGELMFQLDPKQFEAKVEEAKGELAKEQAILTNAKLTVDRLTPLYQQKAASKKDLDNAIANQLASEGSIQALKANLLNAQINLGYTTITSPVTGLAGKSRFFEGALINPSNNSLLTTVSVLDPIWVYFTVSDTDILRGKTQTADKSIVFPKEHEFVVEAIMSDGSVFPYKGKVDFSSPSYDQGTGTLQVRAVFNNPEGDLLPGQFVRVKVYGAERPNAIVVPQRALMQKKGGMFVYLINKDNKVVAQDIGAGEWYKDYQIVTEGLMPGDQVIVDGINKVRPGMEVRVVGSWTPLKQQV